MNGGSLGTLGASGSHVDESRYPIGHLVFTDAESSRPATALT
jgi:hypothetical protein